ncbi:hypothetical protein [Planctomycetes bacterium Pan216]|uniref:hypothetical protein n=1 Tax=Kolteria novifilia TaxID=2527975 RepID=UPI00119D8E18
MPREGFRVDTYSSGNAEILMLAASISAENLFDVMIAMLSRLSDEVDVVVGSHHGLDGTANEPREVVLEHVAIGNLISTCHTFAESFMQDGCLSLAVIDPEIPVEIQLDEHKIFFVYGKNLARFQAILRRLSIDRDENLPLISDGEHIHMTSLRYRDAFEAICEDLRAGQPNENT